MKPRESDRGVRCRRFSRRRGEVNGASAFAYGAPAMKIDSAKPVR